MFTVFLSGSLTSGHQFGRSGRELFHVLEVEDYASMRKYLAEQPDNIEWQARMAPLLEVEDDYSGDDRGIGMVWELPQR